MKAELKARELRIGNKLFFPFIQKNIQVLGINAYEATDGKILNKLSLYDGLSLYCEPITTLKPIPLTEDILLKCGFGKSDEHEMGHNENLNFGFYYDYHFNTFRLDCDDVNNNCDIYLHHIKHLHQLQNLYFALTNEELTINL